MRRAAAAVVRAVVPVAAFALAVPGPVARAGDASYDAVRRGWTRANDAERERLAASLVAAPSLDALAAARDAARAEAQVLAEGRGLREKVEDAAKDADRAPKDVERDRASLRDLDARAARGAAGLSRLATATGAVLDALPDAEFARGAAMLVHDGAREAEPEARTWSFESVGAARRDRTPPMLFDAIASATKAYKKAESDRQGPARKAEEIGKKIADALDEYLKRQQAAGDYSAKVPPGLVDHLLPAKREADRELTRIQRDLDAADRERRGAGTALAHWLSAAPSASAYATLDVLERRLLADADLDLRAIGLAVLGEVPGQRAYERLRQASGDAEPRVVVAALGALGRRTEDEAVPLVAERLADERWRVRAAAAAALADLGRAAGAKPLVEALATAKGRDLDDLRDALVRLTGRTFPAAPGPWASWWDAEGASLVGPRDPAAARAPRPGGGGAPASAQGADDAGGVSFYGIQTHSTRVLFVLDVSGSMNFQGSARDAGRKKIDVLREEVRKSLTGLPDGSLFDLVLFANSVKVWRKDPQARGAKTLADALQFVDKADVVGATNIHDALETAFRLGTTSKEPAFDTIFFMTDGRPTTGKVTDPALILGEVRRWNEARRVRIHVVGMGGKEKERLGASPEERDDLDPGFLKDLAAQNGGQCVLR